MTAEYNNNKQPTAVEYEKKNKRERTATRRVETREANAAAHEKLVLVSFVHTKKVAQPETSRYLKYASKIKHRHHPDKFSRVFGPRSRCVCCCAA